MNLMGISKLVNGRGRLAGVVGWLCGCVIAGAIYGVFKELFGYAGVNTLCYLDWSGLLEELLAPEAGGLLRYCARLLVVLIGEPTWGWAIWLGYASVIYWAMWRLLGALWAVAMMALLCVVPVQLGFSVWTIGDFGLVVQGGLLALVSCVLIGCGRQRMGWGILLLSPVIYWLLGAFALVVTAVVGAFALWQRSRVASVLAGLLALCVPMGYAWLQSDWDLTMGEVWLTNVPLLFEANSLYWNLLSGGTMLALVVGLIGSRAFRGWRMLRGGVWVGALALGGYAIDLSTPRNDYLSLLRAQRLTREGGFGEVLTLTPDNPNPHRLLSGYRILALFRTSQLDDKLFAYPITTAHHKTQIDLAVMDTFTILFEYGFLNHARKFAYEEVVAKGWRPLYLDQMALCALLDGDNRLALRYVDQLARCPLQGERVAWFKRALAAQDAAALSQVIGPRYCVIAEYAQRLAADPACPTFIWGKNPEEIVYLRYAQLKNGNPEMVKLYFAASLLLGQPKILVENLAVLQMLYPAPQTLPRAFAQGLLMAMSHMPPAEQPQLSGEWIGAETYRCFQSFMRDDAQLRVDSTNQVLIDRFLQNYRSSYYFYERHLLP